MVLISSRDLSVSRVVGLHERWRRSIANRLEGAGLGGSPGAIGPQKIGNPRREVVIWDERNHSFAVDDGPVPDSQGRWRA